MNFDLNYFELFFLYLFWAIKGANSVEVKVEINAVLFSQDNSVAHVFVCKLIKDADMLDVKYLRYFPFFYTILDRLWVCFIIPVNEVVLP